MMLAPQLRPRETIEELLRIPEAERHHELIDGQIIRKALPSGEHGDAQSALTALIKGPFQLRQGGKGPGGWWIYTEVEIQLASDALYRPDLAGWRKETTPARPTGQPITIRPDWICEVISPSTAKVDRVAKLNGYYRFGIPHYWLVDPSEETLIVLRRTKEGYLVVLSAQSHEIVRAEPFDAIEIPLTQLFGGETA